MTERLAAFIAKSEGLRIEQIAKELQTSTRELNLPVKKLIAAKRVSTKGQKRATTYFAGGGKSAPRRAGKGSAAPKAKARRATKAAKPAKAAKAAKAARPAKKTRTRVAKTARPASAAPQAEQANQAEETQGTAD
ncbi:MAG TPA: hypothetical protein VGQ57_12135 [Polyangiaceae bacterium]|nr:hypothetical protein [Polyangiaceae bacterium]